MEKERKAGKAVKHAGGRPTLYTVAKGQKVCELVASGLSDRRAAGEVGVPAVTVWRWEERHAEFSAAMARARVARVKALECVAVECVEQMGSMAGSPEFSNGQVQACKNRFEAAVKLLQVYDTRFREKKAVELTGRDGKDLVPSVDQEAMKAAIAASQASFDRVVRQMEDGDKE